MSNRGKGNLNKTEDELQSVVKTLVLKLCTSEEFINELTKTIVATISEQYEERISNLEKENTDINKKYQDLLIKNDKFEQTLKNKSLRIYGLKESKNENCKKTIINFMSKKIGITVKETKIEDCFRIGKYENGKDRPIVIKFTRLDIKRNIYNNKKILKGSGMIIREDLTTEGAKLVKMASEKIGNSNGIVWTNEGSIFAKIKENIIKIRCKNDIEKIVIDQ